MSGGWRVAGGEWRVASGHGFFLVCALLLNDGDEHGDDLIEQIEAMAEYRLRQKLMGAPVPALRFAYFTHGNAQPVSIISPKTTAVSLFNIGANRANIAN